MAGMELPRVPEKVMAFVTDDQLRRILATCRAKSRHAYRAHRDEAILRVLAGSGARLSEVTNLGLEEVDLLSQALRVTGKGRRERPSKTAIPDACDDYGIRCEKSMSMSVSFSNSFPTRTATTSRFGTRARFGSTRSFQAQANCLPSTKNRKLAGSSVVAGSDRTIRRTSSWVAIT